MAKYPRPRKKKEKKSDGSSLLVFLVPPHRLRISRRFLPLFPLLTLLLFARCIPSDSWRILMHGTCAIWQCRPVYRGFIVGPKGSRPNRQKFLYLHSCVFITPSPPSRYVVRSMNLNCELPASFVASGQESSSKNDREPLSRPCHEPVKNLNFKKEISITIWPLALASLVG